MRGDGNLVLYDDENIPLWCTDTDNRVKLLVLYGRAGRGNET